MTRFWKLTPLFALSAAVLLFVVAVLVGLYADREYRAQKVEEARVQASILASAISAALAFNDAPTAANYVGALAANPEIVAAAVYDAQGKLFASILSEGAEPVPSRSDEVAPPTQNGDFVVVTAPVMQGGVHLGSVYMRSLLQSFAQRLSRYGGIAFLGGMALIVLAVLGVAQSALNRANAELKSRADELEETNARLHEQIAERERAEEALRQAQKMESIGQLTGGVAHDFNNLLAIILGNLERVERRLDDGGDVSRIREAIANAKTGAERAATLTNSLLAFSRRQPLRPQPVDVNRLVSGMSEMLRRTLGEEIEIQTVVAGGLWRTSVDPNQLENAILNLAVNARDAMPGGGKLTIETANAHLDERYTDGYDDVSPGQYVMICVSDTGAGMSREVMSRVFEPFFTTKDVGHGTGLGLSQVYGLVKQSGGHINVYSELGEGTTVKIYLPRLASASEAPTIAAVTARETTVAANGRSGSVLVVEDDDGVREHSAAILQELGYAVHSAADGGEALKILSSHPEIVLLFTDVGLPHGMNGRQLADEARRERPELKVLYTTGYARNAIVHDGKLDPGLHLITKPFTYSDLAAAVAGALAHDQPGVLVVEDEVLVRMNTMEFLSDFGFAVFAAGSAAEAERVLETKGEQVRAVIVDLGLPDRKDDEIVVELRAGWPHLPAIIASGSGTNAVRPSLAADPMVRFVPKPYLPEDLRDALESVGVRANGAGTPAS